MSKAPHGFSVQGSEAKVNDRLCRAAHAFKRNLCMLAQSFLISTIKLQGYKYRWYDAPTRLYYIHQHLRERPMHATH